MKQYRKAQIVVISDVHLGTFGCRAKALLEYLQSINPEYLVLNGDIIDAWQFKKKHFKQRHLLVIQRIIEMSLKGTKVVYLTGNHDEFLRRYAPLQLSNIILDNKWVFDLDGKKVWMFHGDIFDASVTGSKWLAKLGGKGYDFLIWLNYNINRFLRLVNQPQMSFSKKIKERVKRAVKFISDFEKTAAELAIEEGYDVVICGHIHVPQMRTIKTKGKSVLYLNSGDWVENLTSLEYTDGNWDIYQFPINEPKTIQKEDFKIPNNSELLEDLLEPVAAVSVL